MASPDKALGLLLELGNPGARRTRTEQLDHVLRTVLALTDGDAAVVFAPTGRRSERMVLHAGSVATALLPPPSPDSPILHSLGEQSEPLALVDLAEDARLVASDGCPGVEAGPVMYTALRQRDPAPGYLAVYRRRGRARFATAEIRSMVLLAASLANSLEVLRLSSGAEKLALTDDLTQVYNARFLKAALKRELKRAGRFGQELSLVLVGLDRYETLCQQNGELRGSALLKETAVLLAHQVRSFDLMSRFGGDQFMVVLPQTDQDGALQVAERMRAAVEFHPFTSMPAGTITASIGVSTFPQEGAEAPALLAAAERALARAQQRGSNRVESYQGRAA